MSGQIKVSFPCEGHEEENLAIGKQASSSSENHNSPASNAINGIIDLESETATTISEFNPYWEVDLEAVYNIKGVKVFRKSDESLSDYYILVSETPFNTSSLFTLLNSENISKNHVASNYSPDSYYDFSNAIKGRYIRIQKNGFGSLSLREIQVPGTNLENCSNRIDDDCDGKIDCDDWDCTPHITNVHIIKHPTCKICNDGSIGVQVSTSNLANLRLSIDGGSTFIEPNSPYHIFENLDEGDYTIVAKDAKSGCQTSWIKNPVNLVAPQGQPQSNCENGDFENGDFTNWTGKTGTANVNGNPPDLSGIIGGRHSILSSGNDFYAPIQIPFSGTYSARLGNKEVGAESESLQYCFTVDNLNADFSFNYAVVLQDPEHSIEQQPYFEYSFSYTENGIKTNIQNFKVVADATNPFFKKVKPNSPILYKGWTCEKIDLSSYIGKEVCAEFIVADCTENIHFGYAYIDGLCSTLEGNTPFISLNINDTYCKNQPVIANASESKRFNQYVWEVCKLNPNGQKVDCASESFINYSITEFNVEEFYNSKGFQFSCGNTYTVQLTLFNDCTEPLSNEKQIKFICESNTLNYDDILICGSFMPAINVQITGNNDCNNCTYEWNPSLTLLGSTTIFPTINGSGNINAFNQDYSVTVTNMQGCQYSDIVKTVELPPIEFTLEPDEKNCTANLFARVTYIVPIHSQFVNVIFQNNTTGEQTPGILVSNSGEATSFLFKYPTEISMNKPSFNATVTWNFDPTGFNVVELGSGCKKTQTYQPAGSPFFGDINFYMPTIFSPDGDGFNDLFGAFFSDIPNVYWGEIDIYDKWGEHIYHFTETLTDLSQPFNYTNLHWNGVSAIDNQLVNPDWYVWVVNFKNCDFPDGIENLPDCQCSRFDLIDGKCGNCNWTGDVTVKR
jgi:hypothetical protein